MLLQSWASQKFLSQNCRVSHERMNTVLFHLLVRKKKADYFNDSLRHFFCENKHILQQCGAYNIKYWITMKLKCKKININNLILF